MSTPHGFFRSVFLFASAVLLGLILHLLAASALGWIQPVWWGGNALFIPVLFGVAFVIVGAMPLYVIAKKWIIKLAGTCSFQNTFVVGVLVGVSVLPLSDALGVLLRPMQLWQSLNPWIAVALTLLMAGVLGSLIAATLLAIF